MHLPRRALLAATPSLLLARSGRADTPTLRVGDQKGGAQALMEAAGLLRQLPYRLQWSQFAGAPMLMEALNAGAIDAGAIGDAPFVFGVAATIVMKAVSVTHADGAVTALVVPSSSSIRSVADLKGRSVATLRGQTGHFLVLAALKRAGLQATDVRFVFLAPSDAKAAMTAGSVDAWATWGPYIALAKVQDGAREVVNGHDLMSGQSYTVAGIEAIASRRPQLTDFLHRLRLAYDWGRANPELQAKAWADQTGFPLAVGRMVVETARTRTIAVDDTSVAAQQHVADFFKESGVIPQAQTVATYFDASFNEAIFAA